MKLHYEVGYKKPQWKDYSHEISNEYHRTRADADLERQQLKNHGMIQTYIKKKGKR